MRIQRCDERNLSILPLLNARAYSAARSSGATRGSTM